ncbi:MAG: integrase core domain-containing protein [Allomuricauda sp.]
MFNLESSNGLFGNSLLNTNWFFSLEDSQEKFDIWREDYNSFQTSIPVRWEICVPTNTSK